MSVKVTNNDWNPVSFVSNNVKAFHKNAPSVVKIITLVCSLLIGIGNWSLICKLFSPITFSVVLIGCVAGPLLMVFSLINIYGYMFRR